MRTSTQNLTARTDATDDLSATTSGMVVTCQSETFAAYGVTVSRFAQDDDSDRDAYDAAFEDYVRDDGTVTTTDGVMRIGKGGRLYPVKPRTRWDAQVADVKVTSKGGVSYLRAGTRSVQVWEEARGYVAACRCGWSHRTVRATLPNGAAGPLTYDDTYAPALALLKWVGIHDAWHRAND